jgi:hypothetical protein
MSATTRAGKASNAELNVTQKSSSAQVNTSASEHGRETLSLCGGDSLTHRVKKESTARYSETKAGTEVQTLSDRLTPSLISAGLVCGIIPMSMRDALGQATLDAVLRRQDGKPAAIPKEDC